MDIKEFQSVKDQIRAIVNDYSEFISVKVAVFNRNDGRPYETVPFDEKMGIMHQWTEEFVEMAAGHMEEEN